MNIHLEAYNPLWKQHFEALREELVSLLGLPEPKIEHIGSTSVEGLSAKPIIDLLIGVADQAHLDRVIAPLMARDYLYYETYNQDMPYRRFFVKHKVSLKSLGLPAIYRQQDIIPATTEEHTRRLAHIHVLPYVSAHWIRHVAFRDYLRTHPTVRQQYQALKEKLVLQEWADGNAYNQAKNHFLKTEEQKAIDWYHTRSR